MILDAKFLCIGYAFLLCHVVSRRLAIGSSFQSTPSGHFQGHLIQGVKLSLKMAIQVSMFQSSNLGGTSASVLDWVKTVR